MDDGAGAIVTALDDNDLTEAVLTKYIEDLEHLTHLGPLQPAVSKLGDRAFNLYAEAARTRELDENEIYALSSLLSQLDPKRIDPKLISALAEDEQVAASIRISAAELLGSAPSEAIWGLVDAALLADDYKRRWPALSALKCAPDVDLRIVDYLRRNDLSETTKLDLIDHLHEALPDKTVQLRFALAHAKNGEIEERYRHRLRVLIASLGDETIMQEMVSEFGTLPIDVISATLTLFGHYRSRQLGKIAVDKLRARCLESEEVATISHGLLIGATYIAKMLSFRSATLHPGPPHPAFDLFVALINEWRAHRRFEVRDQLSIETAASSIGITEATESLHVLVTRVVNECDIGDYENPLNSPVRGAIDELRGKRRLLDLSVAIRLAETSSSNAKMGALYMIAAHGSRQALDYLVKHYSEGCEDRSIILEGIEQLSSRLELTVVRNGKGLRIQTELVRSATVIDSNSI